MICGIDAGGTKTSYVVMNKKGEIVFRHISESMHFLHVGYQGISKELFRFKKILNDKNIDPSKLQLLLGMAGYGEDLKIRQSIEAAVYDVFPHAVIMNDAQFAHISYLNNKEGVLVISGTGSIAYRKLKDQWTRRGGFGYLIDDAGSAFWIGKEILKIFSRQISKEISKTNLYYFLKERLSLVNDYSIIEVVKDETENYRQWVANLAQITSELDDEYIEAGYELAQLANSFKPDIKTNIAVSGSVLKNNSFVYDSFITNLDKNYTMVESNQDVEYAAYLFFKEEDNA